MKNSSLPGEAAPSFAGESAAGECGPLGDEPGGSALCGNCPRLQRGEELLLVDSHEFLSDLSLSRNFPSARLLIPVARLCFRQGGEFGDREESGGRLGHVETS